MTTVKHIGMVSEMKKKYLSPTADLLLVQLADVIVASVVSEGSGSDKDGENGTPPLPFRLDGEE